MFTKLAFILFAMLLAANAQMNAEVMQMHMPEQVAQPVPTAAALTPAPSTTTLPKVEKFEKVEKSNPVAKPSRKARVPTFAARKHRLPQRKLVSNPMNARSSLLAGPQRCCLPPSYEVNFEENAATVDEDGNTVLSRSYSSRAIDRRKGLFAQNTTTVYSDDHDPVEEDYIIDWNTRTVYTIDPINNCASVDTLTEFQWYECIPWRAEFEASETIGGGVTSLALETNVWSWSDDDSEYEASVEAHDCSPIWDETATYDDDGDVSSEVLTLYYDYTVGVKDDSVFDLPEACDDQNKKQDTRKLKRNFRLW